MQFFILGLDGRHKVMALDPLETLDAVAEHVSKLTGLPADRIVFTHEGKYIDSTKTLVDAGVKSESTLKVNLKRAE